MHTDNAHVVKIYYNALQNRHPEPRLVSVAVCDSQSRLSLSRLKANIQLGTCLL